MDKIRYLNIQPERPRHDIKNIERRLEAARALSNANIKCLVWGDDLSVFLFNLPTNLGALELIVSDDKDVERAVEVITKFLPYKVLAGPPDCENFDWETLLWDPSQQGFIPGTVCLRSTMPPPAPMNKYNHEIALQQFYSTRYILVHPQSQFHLDVYDDTRSVVLNTHLPPTIRFPDLTACFDAWIDTYLDPPTGGWDSRLNFTMWRNITDFLRLIFDYDPNEDDSTEDDNDRGDEYISPECAAFVETLRPENRPAFNAFARFLPFYMWHYAIRRKKILVKLGRIEEARRPLPPASHAEHLETLEKYLGFRKKARHRRRKLNRKLLPSVTPSKMTSGGLILTGGNTRPAVLGNGIATQGRPYSAVAYGSVRPIISRFMRLLL